MHVAFRELLGIIKTRRMNLTEKKAEADMIRYLSQVRSQDSNGHFLCFFLSHRSYMLSPPLSHHDNDSPGHTTFLFVPNTSVPMKTQTDSTLTEH